MDKEHVLAQVARCHRIAEVTHDQRFREQLLKLAEEYQRQADETTNEAGDDSGGRDIKGSSRT